MGDPKFAMAMSYAPATAVGKRTTTLAFSTWNIADANFGAETTSAKSTATNAKEEHLPMVPRHVIVCDTRDECVFTPTRALNTAVVSTETRRRRVYQTTAIPRERVTVTTQPMAFDKKFGA